MLEVHLFAKLGLAGQVDVRTHSRKSRTIYVRVKLARYSYKIVKKKPKVGM